MMTDKKKPLSIYIHIPFCIKKCLYCDFLSAAGSEEIKSAYMEQLVREIREKAKGARDYFVQTVFIGGGTPSVVEPRQLKAVMDMLASCYAAAADCETTIEVNPGTVTREKLLSYKQMGINRLSIGLQSSVDEELKALGRIHSRKDFLETYETAIKCGFNNINVDIMSALPGQSLASYIKTLDFLMGLKRKPSHVSAYSLIIEEGTYFYEHTPVLPDEDTEREMYKITDDILKKNGYHRYEISNYAQEGFECAHNKVYWQRGDYAGFGVGAASLIENVRFRNNRETEDYIRGIVKQEERQELSVQEQMEEFMFLGLRLTEGVSSSHFFETFGKKIDEVYPSQIDALCKKGLLLREEMQNAKEERIRLTEYGMDVSNVVMAEFLL